MPRIARDPLTTKAGNYLLRSTQQKALFEVMALVHAERVAVGIAGAHLIKADNTWAGNASYEVKALLKAGMIREGKDFRNGRRWYELTSYGHRAFDTALGWLGKRIDTGALLNKLDATRVE